MTIFEPAVSEGYGWAQPADPADFETLTALEGNPMGSNWSPVRVRLLHADEFGRPLEKADMPWLGSHVLVLAERAVAVLGELLAPDAELLPLWCEEQELWLVNVVRVLEALDLERTRIVRFPSSGRAMAVEHPAFREELIGRVTAFKVPELLRGPIYVTGTIADAASTAQLTGTWFRSLTL